jgi:hypothetical protein
MPFDNDNTISKAKRFSKPKEAFLNALENATRCSHSFQQKHPQKPDEYDKMLLNFIETFISSFPKSAEEIPRTRSVVISKMFVQNNEQILCQGKDHELQRMERYNVSLSSSFARS